MEGVYIKSNNPNLIMRKITDKSQLRDIIQKPPTSNPQTYQSHSKQAMPRNHHSEEQPQETR